ncbi:zinc ribbon domain-containing protein [Lentilactobacillus sp. Marseille-Q4993]|uniref:zinc ribbon domain-containing protein n=1 Tax=Lentilactobacillus sp. Marseille-Q4993 TaxID=3039492 RepID=UPI0024BC3C32|nr:zinc ribbon domain-containing protein [Lentilactobacillus sp. Marseille-Q4993]
MNNESKFCLNCGKTIPAVSKYCPFCGFDQVDLSTNVSQTSKQGSPVKKDSKSRPQHNVATPIWYKNWMVWIVIVLSITTVSSLYALNNRDKAEVVPVTTEKQAAKPVHKSKPKQKEVDPNEIPSNSLEHPSKIGEWKDSPVLGKATLIGLGTKPNTKFSDGPLTVKVKSTEVDTVEAHTDDQVDEAAATFDKEDRIMPRNYSRIKIEYVVNNNTNQSIEYGGVKQLIFPNGYQISSTDDSISDTGSTDTIAAHAKRIEYVLVLLGKSTTTLKPSSIKIVTDESDNSETMDSVSDGTTFSENISYQA